uniref:Uncharacterized protein n=1 Tax=Rhizophora mucronata TaxID=61149 RepID=A0A2P2QBX5_RHIMU
MPNGGKWVDVTLLSLRGLNFY